jgi:hypothetical protein
MLKVRIHIWTTNSFVSVIHTTAIACQIHFLNYQENNRHHVQPISLSLYSLPMKLMRINQGNVY